jgi:hypothetical protein
MAKKKTLEFMERVHVNRKARYGKMNIPECMEAKLVDEEYLAFWESLCPNVEELASRINKLSHVEEIPSPNSNSSIDDCRIRTSGTLPAPPRSHKKSSSTFQNTTAAANDPVVPPSIRRTRSSTHQQLTKNGASSIVVTSEDMVLQDDNRAEMPVSMIPIAIIQESQAGAEDDGNGSFPIDFGGVQLLEIPDPAQQSSEQQAITDIIGARPATQSNLSFSDQQSLGVARSICFKNARSMYGTAVAAQRQSSSSSLGVNFKRNLGGIGGSSYASTIILYPQLINDL